MFMFSSHKQWCACRTAKEVTILKKRTRLQLAEGFTDKQRACFDASGHLNVIYETINSELCCEYLGKISGHLSVYVRKPTNIPELKPFCTEKWGQIHRR